MQHGIVIINFVHAMKDITKMKLNVKHVINLVKFYCQLEYVRIAFSLIYQLVNQKILTINVNANKIRFGLTMNAYVAEAIYMTVMMEFV